MLPDPLIDRFPIQIRLTKYSIREATCIAGTMMGILAPLSRVPYEKAWYISRWAAENPRTIRAILYALRDLASVHDPATFTTDLYDVGAALELMGLSGDGLDLLARQYLDTIYTEFNDGPVGATTTADRLSEVNLTRTEQLLIEKGYLMKSRLGRTLTDLGPRRAA